MFSDLQHPGVFWYTSLPIAAAAAEKESILWALTFKQPTALENQHKRF